MRDIECMHVCVYIQEGIGEAAFANCVVLVILKQMP